MKRGIPKPTVQIALSDHEQSIEKFLSKTGTFKHDDLLVNKDGLRIVSHSKQGEVQLIRPLDNNLALDDMDMVKVVGNGSAGIVQLVRHKWTGQFFALKVMQMNIQENARKQIAQELKINLSSHSLYVVLCYQCFYDNGAISIVLEYMDGGSLSDFLKKVVMIPERYLAAICRQVLKGLIFLHHEKHIIHRDLKPSNILINHRGEVKISDFGVSAILASSSELRDTMTGTYKYMPPERISESKHGYISDIWSFGLVMLECGTGKFAYPPVDSYYDILEAVVENPPPFAPPDQFSKEFCSFISACLQKKPEDRQSAQLLLQHPFLTKHDVSKIDLASYFTNAAPPLATFNDNK
ncbi:Mitogen-activated protein kinase kinase 2 [Platanthera zijinensis]|uniref:mitogen-activated protein kinase kinase n=1 Tax=Platanthera zijinensis TaxID=2320716 RepID=A0AAP0BEG2_9ASPA